MEMADIIKTGGDRDEASQKARRFCEDSLSTWGKQVFAETVEDDWNKRKDEVVNGSTMAAQAAELEW